MTYSILLLCLIFLGASPVSAADEIVGTATAVDGDTLTIDDQVIRLFGVDAPELKQTCLSKKGKTQYCGDLSRQMLETIIRSISVKCMPKGQDPDGAMVAVCYGGPFDINEQMVGSGWALPNRDETDEYVRAETFARARLEGMWRGTFISPKQWRAEHPGE